jgi:BirA family transcriptional regulator, biotin operon repressor / biotin---[acetyl-CoA-carboxylase] ligase
MAMKNNIEIMKLDSVNSTNDFLKRNKNFLQKNFFSVWTDNQTSGRGRNNREWYSVPGSDLACSTVFSNPDELKNVQAVTVYTGIAVLRVLKNYINSDELKIKWPNDIYFADKKICGILCEMVLNENKYCVIIGIGINVNSLYSGTDKKFISIKDIISKDIDVEKLHEEIIISVKKVFKDFCYPVNEDILNEWSENNCSIGRNVVYNFNEETAYGKIECMNPDCSLSVLNNNSNQLTNCFDNVVFI